jgi:pimeloyl-ACP methyl ester carboxylesterase
MGTWLSETVANPPSADDSDARIEEATMGTEIMGPAGRLHVDDGGEGGVPVVFVHSFAGSAAHWAEQLDHLRKKRRAVAFDLRGHGRSEARASEDITIEDLAGDVATVVDELELDRVALVGHSIGGLAAIAYASEHPERVAGLLLAGTPGRVPIQQADEIMSHMTSNYDDTMADYWERLLDHATTATRAQIERDREALPRPVALALIRATFAYDPLPALRDYPGVVMTVTIGDSPYDLQKQLSDVPDSTVTGTSHWAQLDRPEEFDRILDRFLAVVDGEMSAVQPTPAGASASG